MADTYVAGRLIRAKGTHSMRNFEDDVHDEERPTTKVPAAKQACAQTNSTYMWWSNKLKA